MLGKKFPIVGKNFSLLGILNDFEVHRLGKSCSSLELRIWDGRRDFDGRRDIGGNFVVNEEVLPSETKKGVRRPLFRHTLQGK